MPIVPNLIHKVDIQIEQLDVDNTIYDDDFREPIQQSVHKTVVTIKGQPSLSHSDKAAYTRGGVEYQASGYILFRYVDLESAGITLRVEDKIKKIGQLDVDIYIVSLTPTGHYEAGATLVKAFFSDKTPARN